MSTTMVQTTIMLVVEEVALEGLHPQKDLQMLMVVVEMVVKMLQMVWLEQRILVVEVEGLRLNLLIVVPVVLESSSLDMIVLLLVMWT